MPANDTISEVFISTGLGTSLSVGIALIVYDFTHKDTACAGIALLTGGL